MKWGIARGSSRRTFYPVEVPFNIRLLGDYIKVQKEVPFNILLVIIIISWYKMGYRKGSSRRTFYPVEVPFNIGLVGDYIKV